MRSSHSSTFRFLMIAISASGYLAACEGGLPASPHMPSDPAEDVASANTGDLPCEIATILHERCGSCHSATPAYGAPMSLVTRGDLLAPAVSRREVRVADLVPTRIKDPQRTMPPAPNTPLSAAEREVLESWVFAGAPAGPACTTKPASPVPYMPLQCNVDVHLRPSRPTPIAADKMDQYVCYGIERKTDTKRHVIGLAPHIDNTERVHHVLLFQTQEALSSEPTPCEAAASSAWKLIAGWAPGVGPLELPAAAGYPEEGVTHWALQIHYNNSAAAAGQTDASGYDLCTTDELRPNDADMMAAGSLDFAIPPRSTYDLGCDHRWGSSGFREDEEAPTIRVFSVFPHMHKLGQTMSVEKLSSAFRSPIPVMPKQLFDFESQYNRPVEALIAPGDVIRTRCGWKNTSDVRVTAGEGTGDEMCFAFLMYYPRVNSTNWTWNIPSGGPGTICEESIR